MRRMAFIIMSGVVLLFVSNAAGYDRDYALYMNVGISSSSAPESFDNNWGSGPSFGIETAFKFRRELTLGFYFEYDKFNLLDGKILRRAEDEGLLGSNEVLVGSDARFLVYGFSARWYLRRVVRGSRPYIMTGIGMANIKRNNPALKSQYNYEYLSFWSPSEVEEMVFLGAGYDFYLSNIFYLFADARINFVYTDIETSRFALFRLGFAMY